MSVPANSLPVTRIRGRKRQVKRKGYVIARVPRNWPPAECHATYEGTSSLRFTGNPSTTFSDSPWQLYCFRNAPDQQFSAAYCSGGVPATASPPQPFPAVTFRNLTGTDALRAKYNYAVVTGITYEVRWTKYTSLAPHFVGYIWESTEFNTAFHNMANDMDEPVFSPTHGGTLSVSGVWNAANTDDTLQALGQSRRVTQFGSTSPKGIPGTESRVDMVTAFHLDLTKTRRRAHIPKSDYKSSDLSRYGAHDTLSKPEATMHTGRYGYRNQVNIALLGSHMTTGTAIGTSWMDNVTVNVRMHVLHYDRK